MMKYGIEKIYDFIDFISFLNSQQKMLVRYNDLPYLIMVIITQPGTELSTIAH